jgi:serine/threonine kinase 32
MRTVSLFTKIIQFNILLGYLRITDFGIARVWRPENSQDTSGTPGYMGKWTLWCFKIMMISMIAPEVMCRQNHGIQVDYFAVGVIAYECMFGRVTF